MRSEPINIGLPRTSREMRCAPRLFVSAFARWKKYFAPCDADTIGAPVPRVLNVHATAVRSSVRTAVREEPQRAPAASNNSMRGCGRGLYSWAVHDIGILSLGHVVTYFAAFPSRTATS